MPTYIFNVVLAVIQSLFYWPLMISTRCFSTKNDMICWKILWKKWIIYVTVICKVDSIKSSNITVEMWST